LRRLSGPTVVRPLGGHRHADVARSRSRRLRDPLDNETAGAAGQLSGARFECDRRGAASKLTVCDRGWPNPLKTAQYAVLPCSTPLPRFILVEDRCCRFFAE